MSDTNITLIEEGGVDQALEEWAGQQREVLVRLPREVEQYLARRLGVATITPHKGHIQPHLRGAGYRVINWLYLNYIVVDTDTVLRAGLLKFDDRAAVPFIELKLAPEADALFLLQGDEAMIKIAAKMGGRVGGYDGFAYLIGPP